MLRSRRPHLGLATIALTVACAAAAPAGAATNAGDPDPSFGTNGLVTHDVFPGQVIDELTPTAATRLPDGKTLVAAESQSNELLVGRLLGDGTIDPAFGFKRIDVGDTPQQAARILIDSAGRIVVGGRSDNDGFLLRLAATGELDTTFSGDGLVLYSDPSDFVSFDDIALDTDDAIYAYAHDQHTVHRYTAAGGLDPAFGGGDGISVPTPNLAEPRLLLDGNRRIVLASSNSGSDYRAARYQGIGGASPGALDTTFNGTGELLLTGAPTTGTFVDLAVDTANRPLLLGVDTTAGNPDYEVIRLTTGGAVDTSAFGGDGRATGDGLAGVTDEPTRIVARSDGGFTVIGAADTGSVSARIFLALHRAAGDLEPSFNGGATRSISCAGPGGTTCEPTATIAGTAGLGLVGRWRGSTTRGVFGEVTATGAGAGSLGLGASAAFAPTTPWPSTLIDVIQMPDGSAFLLGESGPYNDETTWVARQLPSGALDPAFGTGGVITKDFNPAAPEYNVGVALDASGALLALRGIGTIEVSRFTAAGLDTSYGTAGSLTIPVPGANTAYAGVISVDAIGRFYVGGLETGPGSTRRGWLRRLTAAGTVDAGYHGGAPVFLDLVSLTGDESLDAVLPTTGGDVLVSGRKDISPGVAAAVVTRLDGNGNTVPSYGSSGTATLPDSSPVAAGSRVLLAADRSGRPIAAWTRTPAPSDASVRVVRLTSSGAADPDYGGGGGATALAADTVHDSATDLTVDAEGRAIVVGSRPGLDSTSDTFVVRITAAGAPDSSFGTSGRVITDLAGQGATDRPAAVAVDGDRITTYGTLQHPTQRTSLTATWRLLGAAIVPTPTPAATPTPTPIATPIAPSVRLTISAPKKPRARRALTIKGTALATGGTTAQVQLAIRQIKQGKCLFLRSAKRRTLQSSKPVRGACTRPVFLTAKGTASWSLALRQGLPAGTYEITARATLAAGRPGAAPTTGNAVLRVKVK